MGNDQYSYLPYANEDPPWPEPPPKRRRLTHVPPPVEEVIANFHLSNFKTDELDLLYYGDWGIEEYSFEAKAFLMNQYGSMWDKVNQDLHDNNKNH